MPRLRFAFDQHVNAPALRQLRGCGIDVVHTAEEGLSEADDPDILAWAARGGRIVVTRNYRDYAPLVETCTRRGIAFPGVLFYSSSIRQSDVEHHVRVLHKWVTAAEEAGRNPVQDGLGWLR